MARPSFVCGAYLACDFCPAHAVRLLAWRRSSLLHPSCLRPRLLLRLLLAPLVMGLIRWARVNTPQLIVNVFPSLPSHECNPLSGRLLNRFTKDTEALDINVSGAVNSALTTAVTAALSVVVVVVVTPLAVVIFLPLTFIYYRVQQLYIASSRELKRLDSLAFSPIFQVRAYE